ncbi:MAG: GvpL/GvpF family gas vesicle protein [Acidobacteria bacterium]|nr:GvpL/GvpF family gas vesicle protein [Acidobacteriota bacterium]
MADELVYVYGILAGLPGEPPKDLSGVDGEPIESVEEGGLHAIVSRVSHADFNEEALEQRTADTDWLADLALRHQGVVAWLHEKGDVVPMRLLAVFNSVDSVEDWLRSDRSRLQRIVGDLAGREEWTIRIHFDDERWKGWVDERAAEKDGALAGGGEGGPGREFLLRRKVEMRRAEMAEEVENEMLGSIAASMPDSWKVLVEDRVSRGGADPQITVLVAREAADGIDEQIRSIEANWRERGVTLALSGPWPPYSFVSGGEGV